ncbi:MAG: hypothetical protein A2Y40_06555 [Candidatus Margulisbacteria bacterium GWF2_35_9]|nr:MAG: hypothetical protein A2Y40_06555 [Candidatus Margulisbacteria bacterium GWF2_35_9]
MRCFLSLTNRCNKQCEYCYYHVGVLEASNCEPSLDEIKKCLDFLHKMKCDSVSLTGGEPLVRKDIVDIISYSHKKELKITLVTNGMALAQFLSDKDMLNQISCFAISLHIDQHTDINSYFQYMNSLIKELKKFPGRIRLNFTLTGFNYHYFEKCIDFCDNLNVNFNVQPVVLDENRTGNSVHSLKNIKNEELEYLQMLILKWGKSSSNENYSKKLITYLAGQPIQYDKCLAGVNFFVIHQDLTLLPCFYRQDASVGSLLDKNSNINIIDLSKRFNNVCKNCQGPHCITLCEFGKYL